jgi:hypothetical protein
MWLGHGTQPDFRGQPLAPTIAGYNLWLHPIRDLQLAILPKHIRQCVALPDYGAQPVVLHNCGLQPVVPPKLEAHLRLLLIIEFSQQSLPTMKTMKKFHPTLEHSQWSCSARAPISKCYLQMLPSTPIRTPAWPN